MSLASTNVPDSLLRLCLRLGPSCGVMSGRKLMPGAAWPTIFPCINSGVEMTWLMVCASLFTAVPHEVLLRVGVLRNEWLASFCAQKTEDSYVVVFPLSDIRQLGLAHQLQERFDRCCKERFLHSIPRKVAKATTVRSFAKSPVMTRRSTWMICLERGIGGCDNRTPQHHKEK